MADIDITKLQLADLIQTLIRVSVAEKQIESLSKIIDERDRQYGIQFKAAEETVHAALASQDRQMTSSFLSSEKAIAKAEQAQSEYNIRSNEFRGQLDDQAKLLMPRAEAQSMFTAYEDKLENVKEVIVSNKDATDIAADRLRDEFAKEITSLREARSEASGKTSVLHEVTQAKHWGIGIAIAVFVSLISLSIQFLRH